MSWEDRDYSGDEQRPGFGRPGGDWGGLRPTFDNPLTWAFPIGRIGGITVRVHLFFVIFIVVELLRSSVGSSKGAGSSSLDFNQMAIAMASLFIIVLAHEFGHCLACRWSGGSADEILMWPLGGLAYCRPDNHWKAHFITVIGGPLVNVFLWVVIGVMLGILDGHWLGVAIPDPTSPFNSLRFFVHGSWAMNTLAIINEINFMLLLFNLLPIFPLDGGRIVQSLLWPRIGYSRSMLISVRVGFVGAILLGIYGAVMEMWTLVGVALFGAITCYVTQKQVQFTDEMMGFESDEYALSLHGGAGQDEKDTAPVKPSRQERRAQRQAELEQQESDEVDQILLKIAKSGMNSLSRAEKSVLERVTQRKREQK